MKSALKVLTILLSLAAAVQTVQRARAAINIEAFDIEQNDQTVWSCALYANDILAQEPDPQFKPDTNDYFLELLGDCLGQMRRGHRPSMDIHKFADSPAI